MTQATLLCATKVLKKSRIKFLYVGAVLGPLQVAMDNGAKRALIHHREQAELSRRQRRYY
jgi:hypothetical protein